MKSLYMILLGLFMVSCTGIPEELGPPLPTIPAEWLTKPPTPFITPSVESGNAMAGYPASNEPVTTLAAEAAPTVESPSPTFQFEEDALPTPTLHNLITPSATNTAIPTATSPPTSTPGVVPTRSLSSQIRLGAAQGVPAELVVHAQQMAAARPLDFTWVDNGETADVTLTLETGAPLAAWLYAVAAPFATVEDEISLETVQTTWSGGGADRGPLVLTTDSAASISHHWGNPDAGVLQVDDASLINVLWGQRPSLTIIPFNQLTPLLKVLRVDGSAPIDADFVQEDYPLVVPVNVAGSETAVSEFLAAWDGPTTNRDPQKITRLAMTGVTALVRATATQMEADGILSPVSDVGPVLRSADITHISNEVAFAPDCPEPNPVGGTTFCSQTDYFELITDLQADVIEVTGNHVNDWGSENLEYTLDLYEENGMTYFGGGRNAEDATRPALFEHNGNKIALVGCNPVGPNYAWATPQRAGSRACDAAFYEQIGQLEDEGYQVIATQQYYEFYHYPPTPKQETDFQELIDAGATAVSGSQGHHAQGFDFYNGGFIHYGLGNLFFDQMDMLGTRQTFVDTYTFYDNQLVNVDLWSGLIEDFSRPRLMTTEERAEALQTLFEASGW